LLDTSFIFTYLYNDFFSILGTEEPENSIGKEGTLLVGADERHLALLKPADGIAP